MLNLTDSFLNTEGFDLPCLVLRQVIQHSTHNQKFYCSNKSSQQNIFCSPGRMPQFSKKGKILKDIEHCIIYSFIEVEKGI